MNMKSSPRNDHKAGSTVEFCRQSLHLITYEGETGPREDLVFTVMQLARVARLCDFEVHELMVRGRLAYYQIGDQRYIPASAAADLLADPGFRRAG